MRKNSNFFIPGKNRYSPFLPGFTDHIIFENLLACHQFHFRSAGMPRWIPELRVFSGEHSVVFAPTIFLRFPCRCTPGRADLKRLLFFPAILQKNDLSGIFISKISGDASLLQKNKNKFTFSGSCGHINIYGWKNNRVKLTSPMVPMSFSKNLQIFYGNVPQGAASWPLSLMPVKPSLSGG